MLQTFTHIISITHTSECQPLLHINMNFFPVTIYIIHIMHFRKYPLSIICLFIFCYCNIQYYIPTILPFRVQYIFISIFLLIFLLTYFFSALCIITVSALNFFLAVENIIIMYNYFATILVVSMAKKNIVVSQTYMAINDKYMILVIA